MSLGIEIVLRTVLAFFMMISIAHLLGKQTISQMTYHDFIASVMIGGIAGNLTFNTQINIRQFIYALLSLTVLLLLTTLLSLKSRKLRTLTAGEPTVIIQDGKILERNMKKLRMTFDSLNESLREKNIFDIEEVEHAVMETDGHVSVLKKPDYRTIRRKDLGLLTAGKAKFPVELIMDGEIVEKNFRQNSLTLDWLTMEMSQRGIKLEDISYCVRGTNNQLYFDLYDDQIHSPIDKE
ncbi:DUF421 domain-containing protein [Evansella clarkii]|jgi:uncharacterized membrane protein YcaP (DUF421 family)|uniref:DUF421 domain-containing protein n=1 Tax=Evansella clarkii TaxID=79879 RepID=UPI000996F173|nr:DUF421 domain-containing protein [Evansella clarkii]